MLTKSLQCSLFFIGFSTAIAQSVASKPPAISATIITTINSKLQNGSLLEQTQKTKYFRDADGRIRIEHGTALNIFDAPANLAYRLDMPSRKGTRMEVHRQTTPPSADEIAARNRTWHVQPGDGQRVFIGHKQLSGFAVDGFQMISTVPANSSLGNKEAVVRTIEIWESSKLKLPIYTHISDPLVGEISTTYSNVELNPALDPNLFVVPSGFEVKDVPTTPTEKMSPTAGSFHFSPAAK